MYSNHYKLTEQYIKSLHIDKALALGVYDMSDYTGMLFRQAKEIDLVDNYKEEYLKTAKEYKSKQELQTLLYMNMDEHSTYTDEDAYEFVRKCKLDYDFILVDVDQVYPILKILKERLILQSRDTYSSIVMITGFFNGFYATEETLTAIKENIIFPYLHIGSTLFATTFRAPNFYYHAENIKWDCPIRYLEYYTNKIISLRDYEPDWNKNG